jgi:predicted alpha/beta-fold hydrolase
MERLLKKCCWAILPVVALSVSGCFWSERSFPMEAGNVRRVPPPPLTPAGDPDPMPPRQWLVGANAALKALLPRHPQQPLLTEQMVDSRGRPIDMVHHFAVRTWGLEAICVNFIGLACSAQAANRGDDSTVPPPWPGFQDVWVPICEDLQLAGRMGMAQAADGQAADADCIVILPGIHGGLNALRTRDLALALQQSGLHVLALDLRGQGQTLARYPHKDYAWGVLETDDLLIVSDWLTRQAHVLHTGLVGYSWGANHALLAAWRDGRPGGDDSITPQLAPYLRTLPPGRRYQAGILAFSPILRFEDLMDEMDQPRSAFFHPVLAGLQGTVRDWMIEGNYPNPDGSIHNLIQYTAVQYPHSVEDSLDFLRFLPYKDKPSHDKLNPARMPVLIVHAADDPVAPAQTITDLIARVDNPNVAAIVLPTSGHIGFGPYAPAWYYSLIMSFFDPRGGAAALQE